MIPDVVWCQHKALDPWQSDKHPILPVRAIAFQGRESTACVGHQGTECVQSPGSQREQRVLLLDVRSEAAISKQELLRITSHYSMLCYRFKFSLPSTFAAVVLCATAPAWHARRLCFDLKAKQAGPEWGKGGCGTREGSWPPSWQGTSAVCAFQITPRLC
jgi:hypothetical protein